MADVSKAKKQSALAEAVAIRAAIVCVFNRRSSAEATDVLRRAHVDALSRASLVPDRPAWRLADGPHRVADAIVVDAMELLFSPDLHRVKSCPAIEGCGWLFVDSTRNGTRRWCSMRYCGSRAKAIRASERRRRT
jgi:predicted RNA-binding Zn ribbon-like protein